MKAALTVWQGRISPVLDVAQQILIVSIEGKKIVNKYEEKLPASSIYEQANKIIQLAPHLLVCGAVSQQLLFILLHHNIHIIPFVSGEVERIIETIVKNELNELTAHSFAMPGCRFRWQHCRRRFKDLIR